MTRRRGSRAPKRVHLRLGTPAPGFTLLELTLALAVAAMVALSLYQSMGVCLQARRSAQATVQSVRAATVAMELISRDFESVPPPTGLLAGAFMGFPQNGPSGPADLIDFFTIGADGESAAVGRRPLDEGIRQIELTLRTDVTPPLLVRRISRNLLPRAQVAPEEEILCRGVRSLALRYFDGAAWLDEWDSTALGDTLPMAVEVQIELDNGQPIASDSPPRRITRIIPLACAKVPDASGSSTGAGGAGAGSSGAAATPSAGRRGQ